MALPIRPFGAYAALLLTVGLWATACDPKGSSASKRSRPASETVKAPTCDTVASPQTLSQAAAEISHALETNESLTAFRTFIAAHADKFVQARDLEYGAYAWSVTQWTFIGDQTNRTVALAFPDEVDATAEYSGLGFRLTINGLPEAYEYATSYGPSPDDSQEISVTFGDFSYSGSRNSTDASRHTRHATPWGFTSVDELNGISPERKTTTMNVTAGDNTFAVAFTLYTGTSTSDGFLRWNERVYAWKGEPAGYCTGTVEGFLGLAPDVLPLLVPGDDKAGPLWLKAFPEPWF